MPIHAQFWAVLEAMTHVM